VDALGVNHISVAMIVILASEIAAILLIWRVWRSSDLFFMKVALSIIAVIPVLGPLLTLWIANFPNKVSLELQNRGPRGQFDVRWRRIIDEKSGIRRFRLWRAEVNRDANGDP
jgi:hypothetical protein